MAPPLDDLSPAIAAAGDAGLTLGALKTKFVGAATRGRPEREAALREKLAALTREGAIWGPVRHGGTQYYFGRGRGPSIETASAIVVRLVLQSGTKLVSKPGLEKKVTGMHRRFFADALKHAVASRAIVELSCGTSRYYLHRDTAADRFGFDALDAADSRAPQAAPAPDPVAKSAPALTFETLLPAYRRIKAEQGGFGTVNISDMIKELGVDLDSLHRLLLAEAKAGRVSLHPATSVRLPTEVEDAGIRLPDFPDPFVTVVMKDD